MGEPTTAPILSVQNIEVVYSDVILAVSGVSLEVPGGSIVALLGANGAGKTTLLRAITGLLPIQRGQVTKGTIEFEGHSIIGWEPSAIVRSGLAQVMEGRRVFAELTVIDNLRVGAIARRDRREVRDDLEETLAMFPPLVARLSQPAGVLSGGEQQLLAIGQALMSRPKLLLLDEPSLGLSAMNARQIRNVVVEINRKGTGVLLVEQNARMALGIADHGYILETGKVVRAGLAADLVADRDVKEFYLGMGEEGRRSFRDVKSYRRKKRWSA